MELPQKNIPISNSDVITLCEQIGGMEWEIEQIKNDPPIKPFVFDGASGCPEWLSKKLDRAALPHNIRYWIGGGSHRRFVADRYFREDCITLCGVNQSLAQLAYKIVRVGGSDVFDTTWKWGFGR